MTSNPSNLPWNLMPPQVSPSRLLHAIQFYKKVKKIEIGNPIREFLDDGSFERIQKDPSFWLSHTYEEKIVQHISQSVDLEPVLWESGENLIQKNLYTILPTGNGWDISFGIQDLLRKLPVLLGSTIRYLFLTIQKIQEEEAEFLYWNLPGVNEKWYDPIYIKGFLEGFGKLFNLEGFQVHLKETRLYGIHTNHKKLGNKIRFGSNQNLFHLSWKGSPIVHLASFTNKHEENKNQPVVLVSKEKENIQELPVYDISGLIHKSRELALENRDLEAAVEVLKSFKIELENKQNLIAKDLKLAKNIQKGLIPKYIPDWNGIEFGVYFKPMQEVSGDYFDYFLYGNNKMGVILCDVSGHGVPAAFITALSKMLFSSFKSSQPSKIFKKVNKELLKLLQNQGYTTCVYLLLSSNYKITYSIAGHPRPLHYNFKDDRIQILDGDGTFLGMFPEANDFFDDREFTLNPGDKVFLYTDGLIEAQDENGEMYGEDRLVDMIYKTKNLSIQESIAQIAQDFSKFTMGTDQADDVTLLGLQLNPRIHEWNEKFKLAKNLYEEKKYADAEILFKELNQINPRESKSILYLAKCLAKQKKFLEAIQILERWIQNSDQIHYEFHSVLGYCYYMIGDYEKSEREYKNAMNIEDNHSLIYKNLIQVYEKLGFKDKKLEMEQKYNKNFDTNYKT